MCVCVCAWGIHWLSSCVPCVGVVASGRSPGEAWVCRPGRVVGRTAQFLPTGFPLFGKSRPPSSPLRIRLQLQATLAALRLLLCLVDCTFRRCAAAAGRRWRRHRCASLLLPRCPQRRDHIASFRPGRAPPARRGVGCRAAGLALLTQRSARPRMGGLAACDVRRRGCPGGLGRASRASAARRPPPRAARSPHDDSLPRDE